MKMDKVKEFFNKRKNAIAGGVVAAAGALIGYKYAVFKLNVGWELICAKNPGLKETIITAIENCKSK